MSLQILNDENVTCDKATEICDFLFSPPELTGKSSVLRLSQKENVPPKSIARAMKVTFQTPLRDPQTHRILSPSMTSKLEAPFTLDETVGLANSHRDWTQRDDQQLTRDTDARPDYGGQQQAMASAVSPTEATEPAGSGGPQAPGSTPLSDGAATWVLEGPKNLTTSPGCVPGSPERAVEESICSHSLDKSITCTSENLEGCARTVSLEGAERSSDCPVSSTVTALPSGGQQRETIPADPSSETPAFPEDTCTHQEGEQRPPASAADNTETPSSAAQQEEGSGPTAASPQSEPVRLEIDFSDHPGGRKAPVPQRLGKKPRHKPPARRPESRQEKSSRKAGEEGAPQGSYNLDWDKLDDPNFSRFGGGPQCVGGEAQPPPAAKQRSAEPADAGDTAPTQQEVPVAADYTPMFQVVEEALCAAGKEESVGLPGSELPASPAKLLPQPTEQGPASDLAMETFRDPMEVLGTSAEVDYLEQFGTSSFQESALRKQSLYLKFDPLLKDSPLRVAPVAAATASIPDAGQPSTAEPPPARLVELDFLGALDAPMSALPSGPAACLLPPPSGPIVDVLRYSQEDLDAAVRATQLENQELKGRCEELEEKNQEMGKIMDEFEGIAHQLMEDAQKQKEHVKAEIQTVLKEKDQLAADLNSMEKSFSDLFKRFEKQKEVIEGYRKNEASLKKCVEDYILRVEKEEQRYQALKTHAEEKLRLANEELAQVCSKAQAEALALQASLRREQMRGQSLERTVEQKTKENEELTRICDDLILKMGRI
ncbi:transforming acidic coiled-coil-containing protein 3 isoform X2 [Tamandua tetradactyla]|uniref:transforming acidic coiled-coil-containing protein 3 isoform X2 n=1 Tax=Tamandua tetradactyla TaxID=48850 RepID=UPI004054933C